MPVKLSTTLENVHRNVPNKENVKIILQFYEFMKRNGTSERYQNNNLKAIVIYSKFIGPKTSLDKIENKNQIILFLDTKVRSIEENPDKRWITTWNDYLASFQYLPYFINILFVITAGIR
ncbi:MAG: hypothetical protein ACPKPY_05240 [Nitrososphaeraceae archaeon]